MQRARQWLRALPPYAILAATWIVFIAWAHPGVMTVDSFDQLVEARAGSFTDCHPPAMAAMWRIVDHAIAGPFGLLLIQGTCFLAGLFLILRRAMKPNAAAAWTAAVFLFPPIVAPMAVIWKDCLMAGFLVLGLAWILDDRRRVRLVGLAAFTLATAMRYNAFAATLPLMILLFQWRPGQRAITRYAIAAGAWLGITVVALGCNAALTDRKMYFWASSLALTDIVGTLTMLDGDLPDVELRPLLEPTGIHAEHDLHAAIRAHYTPGNFDKLIGDAFLWSVPLTCAAPAPQAQRDAIGSAWWEILSNHPGAYLRYRLDTFGEVLGVHHKFAGATVIRRGAQAPGVYEAWDVDRTTSGYQDAVDDLLSFFSKRTRLFRPHVYALLALALLWLSRRHRYVLAILLSGLVMELSLFPLAVTPDYRYSHWLVICTCLAVVLLVAERRRA